MIVYIINRKQNFWRPHQIEQTLQWGIKLQLHNALNMQCGDHMSLNAEFALPLYLWKIFSCIFYDFKIDCAFEQGCLHRDICLSLVAGEPYSALGIFILSQDGDVGAITSLNAVWKPCVGETIHDLLQINKINNLWWHHHSITRHTLHIADPAMDLSRPNQLAVDHRLLRVGSFQKTVTISFSLVRGTPHPSGLPLRLEASLVKISMQVV